MAAFRSRAAALVLLLLAACAGEPAATYEFSPLEIPGAASVVAAGINDAGHVVGWYTRADTVRGFIHRDGRHTTVEYPGAVLTQLHGIGPDGAVVGSYRNAGEGPIDFHGFMRTPSGEFVPIDVPGHKSTIAQRLLADGTILGCQHGGDFMGSMRGISIRDGRVTALDLTATMTNGGTPDGSKLVGLVMDTHRGFVVERGVLTQFEVPGAVETEAWDISPSGTIVGVSVSPDSVTHGFAMEDGRFTALDYPGATSTVAFGVNAAGDVVGAFGDAEGRRKGYIARRR